MTSKREWKRRALEAEATVAKLRQELIGAASSVLAAKSVVREAREEVAKARDEVMRAHAVSDEAREATRKAVVTFNSPPYV